MDHLEKAIGDYLTELKNDDAAGNSSLAATESKVDALLATWSAHTPAPVKFRKLTELVRKLERENKDLLAAQDDIADAASDEVRKLRERNAELLAALEAYAEEHQQIAMTANAAHFPGVEPRFSQCQCYRCKLARAALAKAR